MVVATELQGLRLFLLRSRVIINIDAVMRRGVEVGRGMGKRIGRKNL